MRASYAVYRTILLLIVWLEGASATVKLCRSCIWSEHNMQLPKHRRTSRGMTLVSYGLSLIRVRRLRELDYLRSDLSYHLRNYLKYVGGFGLITWLNQNYQQIIIVTHIPNGVAWVWSNLPVSLSLRRSFDNADSTSIRGRIDHGSDLIHTRPTFYGSFIVLLRCFTHFQLNRFH